MFITTKTCSIVGLWFIRTPKMFINTKTLCSVGPLVHKDSQDVYSVITRTRGRVGPLVHKDSQDVYEY